MPFSNLVSMELDDEDKYDLASTYECDYPPGLRFTVYQPDFAALGITIESASVGNTTNFSGEAVVMSRHMEAGNCRVEMQIGQLSIGSGKMAAMERGPFIVFHNHELCCLDLDADECERGDTLGMSGIARIVAVDEPNSDIGISDSISFQIEQMSIENEEDN